MPKFFAHTLLPIAGSIWVFLVMYLCVLGLRLVKLPPESAGTSIGPDVIAYFHALGISAALMFLGWARVFRLNTARTLVGLVLAASPVLVMLWLNLEGLVWYFAKKGPEDLGDWIRLFL